MKMRILLLAAVLAGAFVYVTSNPRWWPRTLGDGESGGPLWSRPQVGRAAGLSTDELNNIDIYKQALGATVNITSTIYRRDFFWNVFPVKESGSGFLVNEEGLIITNNHVVSGSAKVQVTMADQSRYEAEILDRDPSNDLAIIKIQPKKKAAALHLGDSDKLQVGQKVLAIGNPFGLNGTLTTGIISSLGRDIQEDSGRVLQGMMQTDAAINPGNSGGPLLDSQGNVIGVNTAIYGPGGNIGIGFAMPINRVKALMDGFQARGKTGRPRLGVNGVPIAGDLAEALELPRRGGFLVYEVSPGSPAARARIRGARRWVVVGNNEIGIGGDLIMAIDGQPVDQPDAFSRIMARKRPGDSVDLTIFRDGRVQKVTVPLGAASD